MLVLYNLLIVAICFITHYYLGIYEGKPVDWLDSTEKETTLWKQLLDKTDLWVYGELPLRTSLQSRSTFGR